MRRPAFSWLLTLLTLSLAVLLAACSSAPQKTARGSSGATTAATSTARTYRPPPGFPNFVDHSVGREEISIQAMGLVGVPYRWGGNTPDAGFDCSGLVHYVVQRAASVNLPRTTADMSSRGASIDPDDIAAGDLIFFNTTGRAHSHVGIYVGKLRFVNAPSTGGTVRLDYLTNPYWAKRFDGIRRVAPPLAPSKPTPFDAPTYDASAPPPGDNEGAGAAAVAQAQAAAGEQAPRAARGAASQGPATVAAGTTAGAGISTGPAASTGSGSGAYATATSGAAPPASSDQFEPPPSAISTAQSQARAAGAVAPAVVTSPEPMTRNGNALAAPPEPMPGPGAASGAVSGSYTRQNSTARIAIQPTPSARPSARPSDAIDAAADAYEPPPPAAVATRQAQQAQGVVQAPQWPRPAGNVQIMRASTAAQSLPAPTQSNDDPIAGFANSRY
jgi:NlpC/P60 family